MQSAGYNYLWGVRIPYWIAKTLWKWGLPIKKKYRGMSTKSVQRSWGRTKLVTTEGITKFQKVEYCGAKTLSEFVGEADWEYITNNAFKRFHK